MILWPCYRRNRDDPQFESSLCGPVVCVTGVLEINRHQPSFCLAFCVVQNILDRPYGITNNSIFHKSTLIMMKNAM